MSSLKSRQILSLTSLACLIGQLEADPTLSEVQRREMRSAINTIAKVLKMPPHLVAVSADQLREQLHRALPTAVGVSPIRFRNAKSLLRKALALYDPRVIPARSRVGLLPGWAVLLEAPEATPLQRGLARFSKYCSSAAIGPQDVTQAVYEQFHADLAAYCLIRSPRETQQTAGHAWNTAVRSVPGWPQTVLTIADNRRNPSLPWSAFPDTLLADVEAYLPPRVPRTGFSFIRGAPQLEESTISSKRALLRQFATHLVEAGRDPATLRSLADLVTLEAAQAGLGNLYARAGGQDTEHASNIAYLLYGIAKHWLKLDEVTVGKFKQGCKDIRLQKSGMTRKNKLWLKQFDDPKKLHALLHLPDKMMREACATAKPTKVEARIARMALVIEFLLMIPLRIGNVAALELGRTLILDGRRNGHVIIDMSEVKNDIDLEAPLSGEFLRLLHIYLDRFHGLLAPPGCRMLFPSADGGHRREMVMSQDIKTCLARRCGIDLSAHTFRHLAAKLLLEACPGAYGLVRMLLGHKRIATTVNSYCGTEFAQAFLLYDTHITKLRAGGPLRSSRPGPGEARR